MGYDYTTIENVSVPAFDLLGINNAGTVVGFSGLRGAPGSGFPLDGSGLNSSTPSGTENIPGSGTTVNGINNLGATVGAYGLPPPSDDTLGFVDVAGTVTAVVNPNTQGAGGFPTYNELFGVNDFGIAVGAYQASNMSLQGYTYDIATQTFTPVSVASATSTVATGINNAGIICGYETTGATTQGFIDANGTFTLLAGPAGSTLTEALGLNNQGLVVGEFVDPAGTHGFVYDIATAQYTIIDEPDAVTHDGTTYTVVNGINDQDQLVGEYLGGPAGTQGFVATLQGTIQGVDDPVTGSTLAVGPGSGGVAAGGSNAVTIEDRTAGNAVLYGNAGNDTLVALAANDSVVTGTGSNTVYASGAGDSVFLGSGQNTVAAGSGTTVVGGGGTDAVFLSAGAVAVGGASGAMTVIEEGSATVAGGGGGMTVFEGAANGGVYGGSGTTTFVGGTGNGTFVGGSGTALGYAGSGADILFGGSGSATFVGGADAATTIVDELGPATVYFGNGNDVFLGGSANDIASHYGNAGTASTLDATASTGSDLFVMAAGDAVLYEGGGRTTTFLGSGVSDIHGGSGSDLYVQVNGQGGGTDLLRDFRIGTDVVQLSGYGASEIANDLANAAVVGGSTIVTLSDHTSLNFVGVTGLTAASFVG